MAPDAIFALNSMTKPTITSLAAIMLIDASCALRAPCACCSANGHRRSLKVIAIDKLQQLQNALPAGAQLAPEIFFDRE